MNYQEAINYIHSTPKFARSLGNELLTKLLFNLGNPQDKLKFIHIAGTNGKGSCAFMLSEVLIKCGYKVGLYTSPYIERFNERIRINGEPIADDDLAELVTKMKALIESCDAPVSEFALDTAIAFTYFNNMNCDIVVLETGLGGRLDATNVIKKSEISVITSIGLDHTQYLGDTIEKITTEKCGIIKQKGTVICYPDLSLESLHVITHVCKTKRASAILADMPELKEGNSFSYNGKDYSLKMNGDFQKLNASLVICTLEKLKEMGYKITDDAIKQGLYDAFNPGRLEQLPSGVYLDGAHNPSAIKSLCESLKAMGKPVSICLAMMEDKDIREVAEILAELNPKVIITEIPMPRCADAYEVAKEFIHFNITPKVIKDPLDAAKHLINESNNDTTSVICGSLYLVGYLRKELK